MILMAVDYGDVRTGVALCDRLELLASPLTVLVQENPKRLLAQLCALAAEHGVQEIVVGLPRNMDGSEGRRAEKCRAFAAELAEKSALPVTMRDERLSTVSAHRALNATNTRGKKRKEVVDAVSAVIILQDYLDYRKKFASR